MIGILPLPLNYVVLWELGRGLAIIVRNVFRN